MSELPHTISPDTLLPDSIISVHKPTNCSSFDVIRRLRRILKIKKMGHAGTLDPMATGLLIIGINQGTKLLSQYQGMPKTYTGRFLLGQHTASYDKDTPVLETKPTDHITQEALESLRSTFVGEILQQPPPYSARKVQGIRAYKLARQGEDVRLEPNLVHVHSLTWTDISLPWVSFELRCSKGTYVRSLVHAIGEKLGVGAVLHELCRTAIGNIQLGQARTLEAIEHETT